MKLVIDTAVRTLTADGRTLGLYTREAFELLSREWVRVGWSLQYYLGFTWFGLPVLQLPEDLVRFQAAVYRVRPDVIVETGVFRGGSLMFSATLCEALGNGRVIGIDCAISTSDREAIGGHRLGRRISLVEGDSAAEETLERVAGQIRPGESVMVLLDSCHSKEHVARELELYSRLVTPGSYIIAADGVMRDLTDVPGGQTEWAGDNPFEAAREFAAAHPEFAAEGDPGAVSYWPGGWLKRRTSR